MKVVEQNSASNSRLPVSESIPSTNPSDQRRTPYGVRERFRNIPNNFGEFSTEHAFHNENIRPPPDPNILLFVDRVIERIKSYIGTNEQRLRCIKDLLLHFKESKIDEENFINELCEIDWPTSSPYKSKDLVGEKKKVLGAVINAIILELKDEQVGNQMMCTWKDKLAQTTQFPDLKASDMYTSTTLRPGIWLSQTAETSALRGRGVVPNNTAWSSSTASQSRNTEEFPSLSSKPRKQKDTDRIGTKSVWLERNQYTSASASESEGSKRKAKGKGKQVILRLG